MPSLAGTRIDKYEVLEEVGHGGMAVVYRGTDSVLEREVAVKVLHPHLADREESRERLRREALAVAKLRHENILEIFDYSGAEAQESYIVTEFIHGPTLREWIDDTLDPRPAIAALIVHRLCLALSHAHKGGIVHRDIKPENVMIRSEDGCVKLMDFGIAQILDNQKLTLTGQLIGSPAYMAPELISGRPLDQRTDLFSVGILLYQLATGELPFAGRNPHEVLNRIADGDYPAPSTICPLVDRELEGIMARALATNPDDRFQTVEAFGKALEAYLEEMGVQPAGVELAAYFRNPKSYVVELDERVSAALMKQADAAAKQGQSTRAIGLLGRVLELDAGHKEARALLDRLRRQERRMRQLLVGAGSLAAIGLVAAGVLLVPPDPAPEIESVYAEVGPKPEAVIPASSDSPRRPNDTKDGATPEVPEEGEAGDGDDEAGVMAEEGDPPTKKNRDKPRRTNDQVKPALAAGTTECTVRVDGVPAARAKSLKLEVQGERYAIPEDLEVDVTLKGDKATNARLGFNAMYFGTAPLDPRACKAGSVKLAAKRKDAKVTFSGLVSGATVECRGCPAGYTTDVQEPNHIAPIPMGDKDMRTVTFFFTAADYKSATARCLLYPGPNECPVKFKPRDSG